MLKLCKIFIHFHMFFMNQITVFAEEHYCGSTYCNNSKEHVLCKFQLKGPASHCINYERTIKSAKDKRLVLEKINSRRNKVAAGDIRSLRSAENMMSLEWNDELATSAQRWADQCVNHNVPDVKDTCRDLNYTSVGQNIATIYDDAPGLTPTMLVDLWYIELLNVNSSVIAQYERSSVTGPDHYDYFTQLIWAETNEVGCGAVKFKEQLEAFEGYKNRTVYRLVCNFAPAGNLLGKSVYSDGLPCSRCPYNTACNSVYNALCSKNNTSSMKLENSHRNRNKVKEQIVSINSVPYIKSKLLSTTGSNNANSTNDTEQGIGVFSGPEGNSDYDENISFDFFTELFEITTKSSTRVTENTTVCKEILMVDELFDLLKRKLSNDQTLRELLLATTKYSQSGNIEETFTDPSVAEILSHIYTTKESMTTAKTTNEYLNSTLLVDLVEAVIFRNNDKHSTTAAIDLDNQSFTEVNPVKIRAELGETKSNSDFTGHYFFPEDNNDESNIDKQTDNYYDVTDFSTSDVPFELEDLRRNKGTKDFLEEILDSDFIMETISHTYINSPSIEGNKFRYDPSTYVKLDKNEIDQIVRKRRDKDESRNFRSIKTIRKRRRLLTSFISYSDLLKHLAADLKRLKLNKMFHCSHYNSLQTPLRISACLVLTSFLFIQLNIYII